MKNLNVPIDILEAAEKVVNWVVANNLGDDWEMLGIASRVCKRGLQYQNDQFKKILNKILTHSYHGHKEGCFYCGEINEITDHILK